MPVVPAPPDNPFTLLTLIAAPAVLTNASSVLALGTSNRFARAIDRARLLSAQLETEEAAADVLTPLRVRQLDRVEKRSLLLLNALTMFYLSLGSFAAASLVSLLGASLPGADHHVLFKFVQGVALFAGIIGVGGLVFGCTLLVRETRLAVQNVAEEAALVRKRFSQYLQAPPTPGEPG